MFRVIDSPRTEVCPDCGMNHAADVRKKNATQDRIREYRRKIKVLEKQVKELEVDTARYKWLRDEDNWGDDNEGDGWGVLGESNGIAFDALIDKRIKAMEKT